MIAFQVPSKHKCCRPCMRACCLLMESAGHAQAHAKPCVYMLHEQKGQSTNGLACDPGGNGAEAKG